MSFSVVTQFSFFSLSPPNAVIEDNSSWFHIKLLFFTFFLRFFFHLFRECFMYFFVVFMESILLQSSYLKKAFFRALLCELFSVIFLNWEWSPFFVGIKVELFYIVSVWVILRTCAFVLFLQVKWYLYDNGFQREKKRLGNENIF